MHNAAADMVQARYIPLASWGQVSCLCPLPAPCVPPACSLAGQGEKMESS